MIKIKILKENNENDQNEKVRQIRLSKDINTEIVNHLIQSGFTQDEIDSHTGTVLHNITLRQSLEPENFNFVKVPFINLDFTPYHYWIANLLSEKISKFFFMDYFVVKFEQKKDYHETVELMKSMSSPGKLLVCSLYNREFDNILKVPATQGMSTRRRALSSAGVWIRTICSPQPSACTPVTG